MRFDLRKQQVGLLTALANVAGALVLHYHFDEPKRGAAGARSLPDPGEVTRQDAPRAVAWTLLGAVMMFRTRGGMACFDTGKKLQLLTRTVHRQCPRAEIQNYGR